MQIFSQRTQVNFNLTILMPKSQKLFPPFIKLLVEVDLDHLVQILPPARPVLPAKPIKWKQREYSDKFQIIYKFLTNGVDAEDIMYIKNAYEMVRIEVVFCQPG